MALGIYGYGGWDIAAVKAPLEAFADAAAEGERTASVDEAYLRGEVLEGPWTDVPCATAPEVSSDPGGEESAAAEDSVGGAGFVRVGGEVVELAESETTADQTDGTPDVADPDDSSEGENGSGESDASDGSDEAESDSVAKARAAYRTAMRGSAPPRVAVAPEEEEDERRIGAVERYRPRFTPDWVSGGFAYTSGYGFSGAAQIAVSDVLGNHRFYIATNFFSSLESSNFHVLYEHLAHRVNYSLGVYNFKDYYYSDRTWLGEDLGEKRYFSERSYGVSAGLSYPFSMFNRVEFDLSAISVDRQFAEENEQGLIELTDEQVARSLVIPSVRFVNDTTLWGSVGPLSGGRSSIVLQRAWEVGGGFEYLTGIADLRKYVRMGARHSLALKLVAARSSARNAQNFYMGGVNSLRGYDDFEFRGRNLALASIEFRYPFIDHLEIASPIPMSLWGLRGVMFLDAGAAWDDHFRGVADGPNGRRLNDIKASHGVGVRMRLSMFVVRVDWAWPTDFRTAGDVMTHFALGAEF
jgi:hypothetical protein